LLGNESPQWQERYDAIIGMLRREDMSVKERLLALGDLMRPWEAEMRAARGH
jgi:hypothetical protein